MFILIYELRNKDSLLYVSSAEKFIACVNLT